MRDAERMWITPALASSTQSTSSTKRSSQLVNSACRLVSPERTTRARGSAAMVARRRSIAAAGGPVKASGSTWCALSGATLETQFGDAGQGARVVSAFSMRLRMPRASGLCEAASVEVARDQAELAGVALELRAEVGVGDGDQRDRALGQRLALEIDDAVLGHDVHDVGTRRGDDVAGRQAGDDPALAHAVPLVGRGEADERLAAPGRVRPAHELELSAGSRQVPVPVRLGRGLALEI